MSYNLNIEELYIFFGKEIINNWNVGIFTCTNKLVVFVLGILNFIRITTQIK